MASRASLARVADRIFRRNYLFPPHEGRSGMNFLTRPMQGPELRNWYPNFKDPCILDDTGIYKAKEDEYWVQKYLIRDSRGITKPPKGTGWKAFKRTTRGGKGRKKK
jgi:hypothetical protein